ncbi:hypothetical protein [Paenirhodobacter ferrireducens]|uniref:hypothetical protein n=1 Tax=Paenirhodobacter ferrireducens TaxID=1215032 RepID=UPI0013E3683B|nr:hypothetical protein [Sinirhodobacter ferrireducens]
MSIFIYFVYRKCRLYSGTLAPRRHGVFRPRAGTRQDRDFRSGSGKAFRKPRKKEERIPLKNYTNNVVIIVY